MVSKETSKSTGYGSREDCCIKDQRQRTAVIPQSWLYFPASIYHSYGVHALISHTSIAVVNIVNAIDRPSRNATGDNLSSKMLLLYFVICLLEA